MPKAPRRLSRIGLALPVLLLGIASTASVRTRRPGPKRPGARGPTRPEMTDAPHLAAQSAVLMRARDGRILFSQAPLRAEPPASLTKMMTADLTLEAIRQRKIRLDARVPVSRHAFALAHNRILSRMFLRPGLPVTVRQLLFGMMVCSGNDAATAIAGYLGHGSEQRFIRRMNAHARELGLTHTRFIDPDGLSRKSTTDALDMVRLARHLIRTHPEILRYSATRHFTYAGIRQPNYNTLLFRDPRVDGLKTGTLHGHYHLLATGEVEGLRLIALVMGTHGDRQRARQAERLIDWGFRTFGPRGQMIQVEGHK